MSMPTADNASNRPMNTSATRVALLTALRSDNSPPVALRSKRASMADEIHSVTMITMLAVRAPSSIVRTDMVELPTFHLMSSSSSSTTGSKPLTHSTSANQAAHEKVRSKARTTGAFLKATCSTFTITRMAASASNAGTATLNTAMGSARARNTFAV